MPPIPTHTPLVPSVLDRLLDDEPENSREAARTRNQILRELKQSVGRDLENLLNTRWRCVRVPPDLEDLKGSVIDYGIPDFSGANFGSAESREQLREVVEQAIRRFEPRFKSVRVELAPNNDKSDRQLKLRIDALLYADPAPEPVVFDSKLEPVSGDFTIASEA